MPDTPITLLVVDSDVVHRESMARALRAQGYRVLEARSFQDAVNLYQLQAGKIDLLVTAISLPGRNGHELAEQLIAAEPGLRVLFVSGVTGALLSRFYGRDPDNRATLIRPFEPDDLSRRVTELLSRGLGNSAKA